MHLSLLLLHFSLLLLPLSLLLLPLSLLLLPLSLLLLHLSLLLLQLSLLLPHLSSCPPSMYRTVGPFQTSLFHGLIPLLNACVCFQSDGTEVKCTPVKDSSSLVCQVGYPALTVDQEVRSPRVHACTEHVHVKARVLLRSGRSVFLTQRARLPRRSRSRSALTSTLLSCRTKLRWISRPSGWISLVGITQTHSETLVRPVLIRHDTSHTLLLLCSCLLSDSREVKPSDNQVSLSIPVRYDSEIALSR